MRKIVNMSLPQGMTEQLNKIVSGGNYASRSELLREMIRERLAEERIIKDVRASREEFKKGEAKELNSLSDLR